MNRNTLILLGVFALGCAAGMHADSRAQAQSFPTPTTVRKWQQFCEDRVAAGADLNNFLSQKGAEGWELVSTTEHQEVFKSLLVCMKRPVD
ncbi:hypothetical protein JY651_02775 [Pyxidicoccus parkwayensis]|uniref:Lipoprotein n=1 Tax=Pyxidicoccus parkwayensis TaxID=2813578 RepID=A0ABX7P1M7_9BACT|nr:hypothetical protein [Pyxidicoccus parkwaysis]QSQ23926.1 hypothetical protein JY651_02775 [Pyxidicoccus parkwaysis]